MSSIESSVHQPEVVPAQTELVILANIEKLRAEGKLRANSQIGGRGSMRRKLPTKQKGAGNQLQIYEDIIKKFNPSKTPVSNIGGVNFFSSDDPKQNLQFNFPQVNAIGKAHAIVITGKAVQPDVPKSVAEPKVDAEDDEIPDLVGDCDQLSDKIETPQSSKEAQSVEDTPQSDVVQSTDAQQPIETQSQQPETPKGETKPQSTQNKTVERKQNKHEKLLRSLLAKKLKTQEMPAVDTVKLQIKKEFFNVENPFVMRVLIPTKDIYVVFGVIKPWAEESGTIMTDTKSLMADLSQDSEVPDLVSEETKPDKVEEAPTTTIKSDIDMVMTQTNATRDQAMHALNKHNGDIVEAIMSLS